MPALLGVPREHAQQGRLAEPGLRAHEEDLRLVLAREEEAGEELQLRVTTDEPLPSPITQRCKSQIPGGS